MLKGARLLIVIGVVLAACGPTGTVVDGGVWTEGETCPHVFFVGARGTDQDPGIGPQMEDLYSQFLGLLRPVEDIEVGIVALDYPAARGDFGDSAAYEASVLAGRHELSLALDRFASECPSARIVVAGFSQGAHVVAISDLGAVAAVVLLASPVFDPTDATEKSGSFSPDQEGVIDPVALEGDQAERTIQVCLSGDPVCQAGSIAFWIHSNGYYNEALHPAAQFAADQITP